MATSPILRPTMPTGYHIERHAPQGPRSTWDVLVRKTSRTTSVAFSPVPPSDAESQQITFRSGKAVQPVSNDTAHEQRLGRVGPIYASSSNPHSASMKALT